MKDDIICILGPTGSGKSGLGIEIAKEIGGAIISCDSVQVYRGFTIGSGKVRPEEMEGVPHFLLDSVSPDEDFTAADYIVAVEEALAEIRGLGKRPLIVGGTGLYYRAFAYQYSFNEEAGDESYREELYGMWESSPEAVYDLLKEVDPQGAVGIHPNHKTRIIRAIEVFRQTGKSILEQEKGTKGLRNDLISYGLLMERPLLYEGINERVERMIAEGLVEEVKNLLASGVSEEVAPMKTIGYKEVVSHLKNEIGFEEMKELIKKNSRNYGKRQMTWFRKHPEVAWLSYSSPEERQKSKEKILANI